MSPRWKLRLCFGGVAALWFALGLFYGWRLNAADPAPIIREASAPIACPSVVVVSVPAGPPCPDCGERIEDFGDDDFPQVPASSWRDLP